MSYFLLINRIKVQNANAVAGFTWGFPSITHFMGFAHHLSRKLSASRYHETSIHGCGVVAHEHHVHTFGNYNDRFLQSKNPAFLSNDVNKVAKGGSPSIVEEGKMNMTVSLVLEVDGYLGRDASDFIVWVKHKCFSQRLAGGTIISINDIQIFDSESQQDFFKLKRSLIPGFVLMDRSNYLAEYYQSCLEDGDPEQLQVWLDFFLVKQQARPAFDLINNHLSKQPDLALFDVWKEHLNIPYDQQVPMELKKYFSQLGVSKKSESLLKQWADYLNPTSKTAVDWEYLPKSYTGYLVPIMTGYKAISSVYENNEIANTRDSETPVCFVESVHSVGEWKGANRLRNQSDIAACIWRYNYDDGWYLCKQYHQAEDSEDELDQQVEALCNPMDEFN